MRKLFLSSLLALFVGLSTSAVAGVWLHAIVTNPLAGRVIVDTGPFSIDAYRTPCAYAASTVATTFKMQWIGTDGSTVIHEQSMPVLANDLKTLCFPIFGQAPLTFANERYRIIVVGAVTGQVSASLYVPEGI